MMILSSKSVMFITIYSSELAWKGTYLDVIAEEVRHNSSNDIEAHVSSGMSHVRVVVDSRTTSVPEDFMRVLGNEFFL